MARQCKTCGYIDAIDHYPDPGSSEFCSHDIFDGMPGELSDGMTTWVFKLAIEQRCPLFVDRKGDSYLDFLEGKITLAEFQHEE